MHDPAGRDGNPSVSGAGPGGMLGRRGQAVFRRLEALGGHPLVASAWALVRPAAGPLELGFFGRTLLLAAAVGLLAGLVGAAFAAAVDAGQSALLANVAGAKLLRASGEPAGPSGAHPRVLWLLVLLPGAGALVSGLLARWAPEIGGGGGDQTIEAFHRQEARVRKRVLPLKWLASVATLACGGAGGREGPGMQIGSACGSLLAGVLPVSGRERRLLFVAGLAAGISAVFRTPLGAALFAVEVLYRDDFETDALVPAVLASVVGFAVSDHLLGRHVLFGALPSYPFVVRHLPLYGGLAIVASLAGVIFVEALRGVRGLAGRRAIPGWAAPAAGGLLLGGVLLLLHLGGLHHVGPVSADSALLGGGYGLAQVAVRQGGGAPLALAGWFLLLAAMRIAATALTVGSGASAGDFAPALLVGALVGAAFGHAAQGVLQDPSLQPGAFALVGMAALYGGIAHAPLSAVVLVSELTGSYDLLVPLMLAVGAAHVLLRKVSLYPSQEVNRRRATFRAQAGGPPGDERPRSPLAAPRPPRDVLTADPAAPLSALRAAAAAGQPVVPLVDAGGRYVGLVDGKTLLTLATEPDLPGVIALDVAGPALAIQVGESVRSASDRLLASEVGHLPLCEDGRIVGIVSLADVLRAAAGEPPRDPS